MESKKRAHAAVKKEKKQRNCLYFCHLGRCTRDKCPYLHDPSRVAVCRAFLLGRCDAVGYFHAWARLLPFVFHVWARLLSTRMYVSSPAPRLSLYIYVASVMGSWGEASG